MDNKLFITCPFSCMESVLRNKYGNDVFFLTCSGAILHYEEYEYLEAIKDFFLRRNINTIYFVNDTSCRFINGIIKKSKLAGLPAETIMEDIYLDNYQLNFKGQPLFNQQIKLAELNIKMQATEMFNSTIIGNPISLYNIEIKGLVTSKDKNLFKQINYIKYNNKIYEF